MIPDPLMIPDIVKFMRKALLKHQSYKENTDEHYHLAKFHLNLFSAVRSYYMEALYWEKNIGTYKQHEMSKNQREIEMHWLKTEVSELNVQIKKLMALNEMEDK
jgi:hypothetical protein